MEEKLYEEIGFYSTYRKLSFQVFPGEENKGIRSQLGIDQDIKRTFDGFVEQSKQLYDTTIKKSEIMAGFAEFAVTTETFQERLNGLEQLRDLNMTSFLISEMPTDREVFGLYGVEDFLSDGIVHLYLQRMENTSNLYVNINKMRKTNHDKGFFPLIYLN